MESVSNKTISILSSPDRDVETVCFGESPQLPDMLEKNCKSLLECSENFPTVEEISEGEEFQDASEFFKNECQLEYLENIRTSNQNSWLARDSLCRNFDPFFEMYRNLNSAVETEPECTLLSDVSEKTSPKAGSFNHEEETVALSTRESIGNLIQFESPQKNFSNRNTDSPSTSPIPSAPALYTEKELREILKRQELEIAGVNLKKLKDFKLRTEEDLKKKDSKIALLTQIIQSLFLVVQNNKIFIQNLSKMQSFNIERYEEISSQMQTMIDFLKTSSGKVLNIETDFSSFPKAYEECEDLLKTYQKTNCKIRQISTEFQTIQEKLLEHSSLQLTSQNLEELNPEVQAN